MPAVAERAACALCLSQAARAAAIHGAKLDDYRLHYDMAFPGLPARDAKDGKHDEGQARQRLLKCRQKETEWNAVHDKTIPLDGDRPRARANSRERNVPMAKKAREHLGGERLAVHDGEREGELTRERPRERETGAGASTRRSGTSRAHVHGTKRRRASDRESAKPSKLDPFRPAGDWQLAKAVVKVYREPKGRKMMVVRVRGGIV